jgi:outer membrane biosynthesis protein TonB
MTLKCRENAPRRAFSRLATVRRSAALALATLLGLSTALALASCGGGNDAKLLPGATAEEITENLDQVRQLVSDGECVGATDAAQQVSAQVEELGGVDAKLKQALQDGASRLGEVVAECEEATAETVAPSPEATTTESTEPPGQEKKREKEEEKAEKEAENQQGEKEVPPTPPAKAPPTPPAEEAPPTETGGTGASGGVSPGAPVEGEGGEE